MVRQVEAAQQIDNTHKQVRHTWMGTGLCRAVSTTMITAVQWSTTVSPGLPPRASWMAARPAATAQLCRGEEGLPRTGGAGGAGGWTGGKGAGGKGQEGAGAGALQEGLSAGQCGPNPGGSLQPPPGGRGRPGGPPVLLPGTLEGHESTGMAILTLD